MGLNEKFYKSSSDEDHPVHRVGRMQRDSVFAICIAIFITSCILFIYIDQRQLIVKINETLTPNGDMGVKLRKTGSKNLYELPRISSYKQSQMYNPRPRQQNCSDSIPDSQKFDCNPEKFANEKSCLDRGCCWHDRKRDKRSGFGSPRRVSRIGPPSCYYPPEYPGYLITSNVQTPLGQNLTLKKEGRSFYPKDVMKLQATVTYEKKDRLRIKIFDPNNARWQVPIKTPVVYKKADPVDYDVTFGSGTSKKFAITVTRKSSGTKIIDTTVGNLIFSGQFLQISTKLASHYVYGLGEHEDHLLHSTNWTCLNLWTKGEVLRLDIDSYGAHPFYTVMESDGNSHGVFILNSNAIEVVLQPTPAATIRSLGGILDLYVFLGPTPGAVIQQYQEVVGRPFMVPYWSLGFHLCRWQFPGVHNMSYLNGLVSRMRKLGFPYEAQWLASDYMDRYKDFTYDKTNLAGLPQFVDNLHEFGQRNVILIDPNINVNQTPGTYPPYDDLVKEDLYVKHLDGQPLIGHGLSGDVMFVDFSNPSSQRFWTEQSATFHDVLKFDGLWIDKGEPENIIDGSTRGCPFNSSLDNPPYMPYVNFYGPTLYNNTLCPSAQQNLTSHYNIHNMSRYLHLPYLYTLFFRSTNFGETVARPLFFEFPDDSNTFSIDKQYMLGKALLVSPCLEQGAVKVTAYLPTAYWYNLFNGVLTKGNGTSVVFDAPLEGINVHIRGGNILPVQIPSRKADSWPVTTTESRKNLFGVTVAPDASYLSTGELFWDDGITLGTFKNKNFNRIRFVSDKTTLNITAERGFYTDEPMLMGFANIYNCMLETVGPVTVNGKPATYGYAPDTKILTVFDFKLSMLEPIYIAWNVEN